MTVPTESRSRFRARPNVGWPALFAGNSSISPCIASDRPWTRQMPSVTETTVPWLRMSVDAPRPSIRLLISSEISAGFNCMTVLPNSEAREPPGVEGRSWRCPSVGQRDTHLVEPGADGGVQHLVADRDAHAADERAVDRDFGLERAPEALLQR